MVYSLLPQYDYVIVGSGFFGSTCAYELTKKGYKVLVVEKRNHIGGNCYTEEKEGIHIHKYGAHIFHTNDEEVWNWINQFCKFRNFHHSPIANFKGELFSLPFNMWTFNKLWEVKTEKEAKEKIDSQKFTGTVTNLEEQALALVGKDIYETLIKGYTEKQWGKKCSELPPSIIKRLPVRFNWDTNYFNDKFQGMPVGGYTQIFDKLLENIPVQLNTDFHENKRYYEQIATKIIYTGPIDRFYDYEFGKLEYRSLYWENEFLENTNFQSHPVINYTDSETPYTRIVEHKYFDFQNQKSTLISKEFSCDYDGQNEPYYPIRNQENIQVFEKYQKKSSEETKYIFGGRLGSYVYYDMHQVIASALKLCEKVPPVN